jgi:hypothetical protein
MNELLESGEYSILQSKKKLLLKLLLKWILREVLNLIE